MDFPAQLDWWTMHSTWTFQRNPFDGEYPYPFNDLFTHQAKSSNSVQKLTLHWPNLLYMFSRCKWYIWIFTCVSAWGWSRCGWSHCSSTYHIGILVLMEGECSWKRLSWHSADIYVTCLVLGISCHTIIIPACKTDYPARAHGVNLTVYHDITEWGLSLNSSHTYHNLYFPNSGEIHLQN